MGSENLPQKEYIPIRIIWYQTWWVRFIAICYVVFLLALVLTHHIQMFPLSMFGELSLSLGQSPLYLLAIGLGGIVCLSMLIRTRYLIIDRSKALIYYQRSILGYSVYYFVEVLSVQLELDMSKALDRLKIEKLYRVYLKLPKEQLLLVREAWGEEIAFSLAEKLKKTFAVEIENLQRVGRKRGQDIHLGRYTLEKELSHGGMGKVFLGKEKASGHSVAIKVLPSSLAANQDYVENFFREAEILKRLSHPSIVGIKDVGQDGDVYFYAMEFIEGKALDDLVKDKVLSIEQSARFVLQVALALDYIHGHNIIHRDIKPSNIMSRKEGGVAVIDFGIAYDFSFLLEDSRLYGYYIEVSHYKGTLPYMSPEQLSSQSEIDHRTDIYSLGVTFYELLVGKRPFRGGSQSLMRSILGWYPPEPSKINPQVPPQLDAIIMRAMEKDKSSRYQSGASMANDIHRWLHNLPVQSSRPNKIKRMWRRFRGFFWWLC